MILYINGDSHTAAAEAASPHAFAEDDSRYFYMGRSPHPSNMSVSWGRQLADALKTPLHCDAESAASNARIMRTARHWISGHRARLTQTLMIIQWSTWEREEWLHEGTYYQVNASGIDHVPDALKSRYKNFVALIDWRKCQTQAHREIWEFHCELKNLGVKHIMFNGNNHFGDLPDRQDWGNNYIEPYDPKMTYDAWLKSNGYDTVAPDSWHFGTDAHAAWHRFMLQYIIKHNFI